MTKSTHHSFDIELASQYGIPGAILIHHFQHWVNHNKRQGKNKKDGRTWTYQTRKEIAAWFPYFSEDQVKRETNKLVDAGVLMKGNYNKAAMDKTLWYAFKNEEMFTMGDSANSMGDSAPSMGDSAKAIPDTKTDTETKNNNGTPAAVVVPSCLEKLEGTSHVQTGHPSRSNGTHPTFKRDTNTETTTENSTKNNNGTPAAVVVPSCLEKIEISESLKQKLTKTYTEPQIVQALACLENMYPDNLEATIQAALRDGWEPKGAPEDQEAKSLEFLDKCRMADGKTLGPYKVQIGPRYIHFQHSRIDGSLDQHYEVEQKGFIGAIQALIAKHK